MSAAPSFADLTGRLRLRPGAPLPNIDSSRPELAPRLARGRRADELPGLLAAVFTLCGHAHRLTAERAVRAAQGLADAAAPGAGRALQLATAREQVLRLVNDWPLGGGDGGHDAAHGLLRSCPLWRADLPASDQLAALPGWLQQHWLGMAPADWLARDEAEPLDWPARWAQQAAAASPVARWLRQVQARAAALRTPHRPLALLGDAATPLPAWAQRLGHAPAPDAWAPAGGVPDTGPWARHHAPSPRPADNAWVRLTSRVTDLLHLAAPDGGQWLAHGGLALGGGQGLAWAETARGLLLHWVRLQDSADGLRVADCRVVAPTDWNFHPRGVLADALSALPRQRDAAGLDADARLLALAFDPCVPFEVDVHHAPREVAHA
ncbi:MAG: hypothetical protein U1F53_09965 [Burkholderiaceae bacterium]